MGNMGNWRTGGIEIGDLIRIDTGEFEGRLGYGWARGRLKHGDILLAIEHSGDCFFNYILIDHNEMTLEGKSMLRLTPVPVPFGAYTLGRVLGSVGFEGMMRLKGGQEVSIDMPDNYATPDLPNVDGEPFKTYRDLVRNLRALPDRVLDTVFDMPDDTGRSAKGGRFHYDRIGGSESVYILND